ncbi:MAG: DUF2132 domain-containing protein [Gammaproteobacteria bacterium]|nr:DUF2132 domain-containing protein [Gammaproteobacteria bacterium]
MTNEINYQNNPLHGVSLKKMLGEIVDHYGFDILYAYLNINSFKNNPSIDSSVKFLKKTDWAREKVEGFYLYEYKNLPRASSAQFLLSPRDRVIPDDQSPGEPAELSLEDAERLREQRVSKSDAYGKGSKNHSKSGEKYRDQLKQHPVSRDNTGSAKNEPERPESSGSSSERPVDPWAKSRKKPANQD